MGVGSVGLLVGRAEQLDVLRLLLGRALAGEPQLVLVVGEPGIGKTRLVGEFVAGVDDESVRVLATQCLELAGAEVPLAPVQELVHGAFRRWGAQAVREASGAYLPMLAVLEPALAAAEDAPATGPVTNQRQLFSAVRHLLEQLADAGPLLVVVEDVHWADEATLDLLRYLAVALDDVPVLLVATLRTGTSAARAGADLHWAPAAGHDAGAGRVVAGGGRWARRGAGRGRRAARAPSGLGARHWPGG